MNQTLLYLEIILSFCVVCGVTDYISDTTDPSDGTFTYCSGSGWVAYKDEKCFKLIKKWATHDSAEIICNQEYFRTDSFAPTLVSIKSSAEQEYLTKFVFNTPNSNNVWIGAKRWPENGTVFVWNDGSVIDFDNWAEGSPTEETKRSCVAMQSEFSKQLSNMSDLDQRAINGKWKDVTCDTGNWVLCQKLQTWSFPQLQKTFLDSRKELQNSLNDVTKQLNDTRNQLDNTINDLTTTKNELTNTKNELTTTKNELTSTKNELTTTKNNLEVLQKNPIPIGFIYVQLSGQPEPKSLWSMVGWEDVTSAYAGLFFRAEGNGSAAFGKTQEENNHKLTNVQNNNLKGDGVPTNSIEVKANSQWSEYIETGSIYYEENTEPIFIHLRFKVSGGEVRPRNKAIRIWKRTK